VETARLRVCAECEVVFLVCGWNHRKYCGPDCAKTAEKERHRRERRLFRQSPEGRAKHREEEQRRRDRRRGVGGGIVRGASEAAKVAVMESASGIVAARPLTSRLVAWRVVVGAALAGLAEELRARRTVLECVCCGRRGRVAEVVVWGRDHRQRGDDGA
jgi:hypothetical protein